MKWTYYIKPKVKIAISMMVIILLVLVTNFINKRNLNALQDHFTSVYQDRLMAEVYIYQIAGILSEKQVLELTGGKQHDHQKLNDSISSIISAYDKTYLTEEEAVYYDQLKESLKKMVRAENSSDRSFYRHSGIYQELEEQLAKLSEVQRNEGKRLTDESSYIVASGKTNLQFELVILIGIGIIIQVLLFAAKSEVPAFKQDPRLN